MLRSVLSDSKAVTVRLEPVGRRVEVESTETLLAAIQAAGIQIAAVCGGEGVCGKCVVRPLSGELSAVSDSEKNLLSETDLAHGYRLACRAHLKSDVTLYIPPESLTTEQRLQTEGTESELELDPVIRLIDLTVAKPDIHDLRSDTRRFCDACGENNVDGLSLGMPMLRTLSRDLREQDWKVRIASDGKEIIAILPREGSAFGLAVDIGTTKLAAYLVELETGRLLAKMGKVNPQVAYGDDVVNRIAYANSHHDGREILRNKLLAAINEMVAELCSTARMTPEDILEAVVVGNTAMHHLFAGLSVKQLGEAPYVPAVDEPLRTRCSELGLQLAPGAYTYLPPNVAGYVGADHVAMVLATHLLRLEETVLAIDVGTNTEVSLFSEGRLLTCSCASGPAFEGAHIQFGMRAVPGAIERVEIYDGAVFTQTIDNGKPVGICGSGILDAVAQMCEAGVIDRTGRLNQDYPGVTADVHGGKFCLVPRRKSANKADITLSRKDINEIQLAKAAIRTGIEILLLEAGRQAEEIESFVIAGAFGTYLDVESAKRIGMFPDLSRDRFHQVGNAAGTGAREMLVSKKARQEAEIIKEKITYVELTVHPSFFDVYTSQLMF